MQVRFSECVVEIVCDDPDEADFACDDAEVALSPDVMELSYFDDEGPVVFVGRVGEAGAFELVCRSRPRTGSLRRVGETTAFEGEWEEGDLRGSIRLVLPERGVG